jgi:class 3 adenylate cyclase
MEAVMNSAGSPQSILFANVSGRARVHEKLGSSEALQAVDRFLKRMRRAVEANGGRMLKSVGDALTAEFDSADAAFQAAIEMRQRVADLPPVSGVKLAIRVGFAHRALAEVDGRGGETVELAAQLAAMAKPGQILSDSAVHAALSPALQLSMHLLPPAATKGRSAGMTVFEIIAADSSRRVNTATIADAPHAAEGTGLPRLRMRVRYAGATLVLDDSLPVIEIGRDSESHIVIRDQRASRNHARIERQGERIVVIDSSTNGTYVTLNGKPELLLRREDCVIHGQGLISFAGSAKGSDADCAQFEEF